MRDIKYTYHIDLDERGRFMSHVENTRGRVIVAYDLPQWMCLECGNHADNCTCENEDNLYQEFDIFSGMMEIVSGIYDVDGLELHYKECGIMPQSARLVLIK